MTETVSRLMSFAPPGYGRLKRKSKGHRLPKKRRTSSAAKFLRLAQEWQRQLDAGEIESQAAIARREDLTRARVCQIMSLRRCERSLAGAVCLGYDIVWH